MTRMEAKVSRRTESKRVVVTFPQKQWEMFERICLQQAAMDGRRGLKYLVADTAIAGSFPIREAVDRDQEMTVASDDEVSEQARES